MEEEQRLQQTEEGRLEEDRMQRCGREGGKGEVREKEKGAGGMEEEQRLQQTEEGRLLEDRMQRRCGGEGGKGEVDEKEEEAARRAWPTARCWKQGWRNMRDRYHSRVRTIQGEGAAMMTLELQPLHRQQPLLSQQPANPL